MILAFIFLTFLLPGRPAVDRPKTSPPKWIDLFDGRSQWRGFRSKEFPASVWSIQGGCIYRKKTDSDYRRDLVTRREFSSFELEFEWKIAEGGNSGIKYLVREDRPESWDKASYEYSRKDLIRRGLQNSKEFKDLTPRKPYYSPIGFEFQLLDDARNPEGMKGGKRVTGALYDILPRAARVYAPANTFNSGRIVVRGSTVQHWVNGIKVLEYQRDGDALQKGIAAGKFARMPGFGRNPRGRITLQDHGDEVWFRRIRIRQLR